MPVYCPRHPNEETSLSCGRCETIVCTRCMVHTDVGIRCRDCAPPRSRFADNRARLYVIGGVAGLLVLAVAGTSIAGVDLSSSNEDYLGYYEDYIDELGALSGEATVDEVVDPWVSEDPEHQPAPGSRFVALQITVENAGGGEVPVYVSSSSFKLTDTEDFVYSPTYGGNLKPALQEGVELAEGEKTRGWILFELPEASKIKSLTYFRSEVQLPGP